MSVSNVLGTALACFFLIKNPRHCKRYALFIALGLAVFAYSYNPTGTSDLTRYIETILKARDMPISDYFLQRGDNLFITNTVFWIAGQLNLPHLVPAISVLVVYAVTFYITTDFAVLTGNEKNVWKVMLIQMMCLNYVNVMNNVRNICAFAVIILALYRESIKKKRDALTIVLYIAACFIHESGIILVVIRLVQFILRKRIVIAVGLAAVIPTVVNFLFPYTKVIARYGAIGTIISNFLRVSYYAMYSTSRWARVVMSSSRHLADRYLSMALCAVLFAAICYLLWQKQGNMMFIFLAMLCLFTISCNVFRTPAYWRMYSACVCCGGPLLLMMDPGRKYRKPVIRLLYGAVLILTVLLFVVHSYSSASDISYIELFEQSLMTPLAVIVVQFFMALF